MILIKGAASAVFAYQSTFPVERWEGCSDDLSAPGSWRVISSVAPVVMVAMRASVTWLRRVFISAQEATTAAAAFGT